MSWFHTLSLVCELVPLSCVASSGQKGHSTAVPAHSHGGRPGWWARPLYLPPRHRGTPVSPTPRTQPQPVGLSSCLCPSCFLRGGRKENSPENRPTAIGFATHNKRLFGHRVDCHSSRSLLSDEMASLVCTEQDEMCVITDITGG